VILLQEQILDFIKKPKNEALIHRAREIFKTHQLHVKGIGLQEFLARIEGYENETQATLRRKLAKSTTVPLVGKETDLMAKIFSAQGTNKYYDLSENNEKDFRLYLNEDVGEGLSIKEWMRDIWLDKINYDPSGVVMGELPVEPLSKPEPYVVFRSILDIHDYYFKGNRVEYIIFKKEYTYTDIVNGVNTEKKKCIYRVIDDAYDYLVELKNGNYTFVPDATIPNPWGYVPCKLISNQRDSKSNARTTYIWKAIDTCDEYLLDSSIHTITKKLHGFPRIWERQRDCKKCKGNGYMSYLDKDNITPVQSPCNECNGTGKNNKDDVSDKIIVPLLNQQGQPDNVPVMGYVQIDNDTPKTQVEFLERLEKLIHIGIWSNNESEISYSGTDKTATGSLLNVQTIWDKLCLLSENAQEIELFITNLIGQVRYGADYKGSVINYGKRYFVRSSDEVEQLYLTAKKGGMPSHILDAYIEELIYIRFGNDAVELEKQLKLNSIEPFIHLSSAELKTMGVSQSDFFMKLYFTDYIEQYERDVKPISISTEDEILKKLEEYNRQKISIGGGQVQTQTT
jgi:hypothetical protein